MADKNTPGTEPTTAKFIYTGPATVHVDGEAEVKVWHGKQLELKLESKLIPMLKAKGYLTEVK